MSPQDFDPTALSRGDLLAIFDADPRLAEEKYIALHRNLVRYFEWNRKLEPEDMAQEALERGFVRLQEGQKITTPDPAGYFFGIARNLVRESWTPRKEKQLDQVELPPLGTSFHNLNPGEQLVLLRECLGGLPRDEFEMLMAYVEGDGKEWARGAGLQPGAMRLRVHRLRKRLEKLLNTGVVDRKQKKS